MFNDMSSDIKSLYKDITTYKATTPIGSSSAVIYSLTPTGNVYDYEGDMAVTPGGYGSFGAVFRIDVITDSTVPPMCSVKYECLINGENIENKLMENVGFSTDYTTARIYQQASSSEGPGDYIAPAGYWGDSEKKGVTYEAVFTYNYFFSSEPPATLPTPRIQVKFKILSTINAQIRLTRLAK